MKRTSNIDKAQCSIYFTRFHQTINILNEDIKCVEIKPDITLGVRLTAGWQTRQRQDADSSCAVVTWGMVATCNCGAGAAVDTVNNYKQTHLYLHTAHLTHSLYIVWPCMTTRHYYGHYSQTAQNTHKKTLRRVDSGHWAQCTVAQCSLTITFISCVHKHIVSCLGSVQVFRCYHSDSELQIPEHCSIHLDHR